jgi:radical SAM protein with 4Fe4S-binding SPASM domain
MSTGHIDDRTEPRRERAREQFERLAPWKACGDCAFLPVCAGGCAAMSFSQRGDMQVPTCHRRSLESAFTSLAHSAASAVT